MAPIAIVGYLLLFATVAVLFVLASLLLGRFVRPSEPSPQKLAIYECGEPPIGSSSVQFDLRFYVVALVFIIFEVEVAFFFPWATVFGQMVRPANAEQSQVAVDVAQAASPDEAASAFELTTAARRLALVSMADIGVFFAVLLVGFAYVWRRGDLDWVRATGVPAAVPAEMEALPGER